MLEGEPNPTNLKERSDLRKAMERFFGIFEGATLINSDGKTITLKINAPENAGEPAQAKSMDRPEPWSLTFENYTEKGRGGNYVDFEVDYLRMDVKIPWARLTDKDLRGKGIYPQIMKMIAQNLPDGFGLSGTVGRPKEHASATKLFNDWEADRIDEDTLKKGLLASNMLVRGQRSGFNTFEVRHTTSDEVEITSRKNPNQESVSVVVQKKPGQGTPKAIRS